MNDVTKMPNGGLATALTAISLAAMIPIIGLSQTAPKAADKDTLVTDMNAYRHSKGLKSTLTRNAVLDLAAQNYADVLATTGLTGHTVPMTTPNGKQCVNVEDRVAIAAMSQISDAAKKATSPFIFSIVNKDAIAGGAPQSFWVKSVVVGEILTYGWSTPAEALKAWQGSPQHNGAMLQPASDPRGEWVNLGVGISTRKIGGYNWVVVFGNPNSDTATQMTLDGQFGGKAMLAKYQYYTNWVKK
jgi:uncharacterized protein YkwD